MDTLAFLDRLRLMNWVQQKFNQEKAVADHAERIWTDLCVSIKEAVDSFNELYIQNGDEKVGYNPNGRRMQVTRRLPPSPTPPRLPVYSKVDFWLDVGRPTTINILGTIPRAGSPPKKRSMTINILADDNLQVFLCDENEKLTPNELSRRILEPLLFDV